MSSMLAAPSLPQDPLSPQQQQQQVGAKPFLANAGIGNRPTLLTVSLVYDESGEASAFHVALIPRTTGDDTVEGGQGKRSSTEYGAGAPGFIVQKAAARHKGGAAGAEAGVAQEAGAGAVQETEGRGAEEGTEEVGGARKRSPGRTWDAVGHAKFQKRRAAPA